VKRFAARLLIGLIVAMMAATVAEADQTPSQPACAKNQSTSSGIGSLIPSCDLTNGNQQLLSERYSTSDYLPLGDPGGSDNSPGLLHPDEWLSAALNGLAGSLMAMVLLVGLAAGALVKLAFTMDLPGQHAVGSSIDAVVGAMTKQIYDVALPVVLLLVGAWLLWVMILRRRASQGFEGIAWVVLAMAVSAVYFSSPSTVMSGVDDFASTFSMVMLGATSGADPSMSGQTRPNDPTLRAGDAGSAELRLFSDRFWHNFVYVPWTTAQFGQADPAGSNGTSLGEELLQKQSGQNSNFDNDLGNNKDAHDWYTGKEGLNRLVIAGLALVVVVLAAVLFVIIAGAVLVAQVGLLLLMMVAPLFFIVGIHPSGRRLFIRWLELVAGVLAVRLLYAALLGVLIVLSGVVTQAADQVSWLLGAVLQVALIVAILIYRKPFMAIFAQVGTPKGVMSHIGGSKAAEAASGAVSRAQGWIGRQAMGSPVPSAESAASSAASSTMATGRTAAMTATKTAATTGGQAAVAGGTEAAAAAAGGTGAAASSGAVAAGGAATGGALIAAYVALEGGKKAIGGIAKGKRARQDKAGVFIVNEGGASHPAGYQAPRPPTNDSGEPLSLKDIRQRRAERAEYSRQRQQQRQGPSLPGPAPKASGPTPPPAGPPAKSS
jgi:hypothetical protein